jgi:hypothetical protein
MHSTLSHHGLSTLEINRLSTLKINGRRIRWILRRARKFVVVVSYFLLVLSYISFENNIDWIMISHGDQDRI